MNKIDKRLNIASLTSLIILLLTTLFLFGVNLYATMTKTPENEKKLAKKVYVVSDKEKTKKHKEKIRRKHAINHEHDMLPPKAVKPAFVTHVTITTYHPVAAQCDATPDIMANNQRIDFKKLKNGTFRPVAISRDLKPYLEFGSIIEIEGVHYEVCDLMNKRFTHCIDIMLHPSNKNTYKKTNVLVKKIS